MPTISKIQRARTSTIYNAKFDNWPLDWLSHFVQKLQRKLVVEKANIVLENIRLVKRSGSIRNGACSHLQASFTASRERLSAHLLKEDQQLVPFICHLVQAEELHVKVNRQLLNNAERFINVLIDEHTAEMNQVKHSFDLKEILAALSNPPRSVNILLAGLLDFEQTCQLHIDLQNRIMFPRIIAAKYRTD